MAEVREVLFAPPSRQVGRESDVRVRTPPAYKCCAFEGIEIAFWRPC
jgi:hypothetical protein